MTNTAQQYSEQDRGNSARYKKYLAGMDSIIVEKIASASAYFPHIEGCSIVDVGMASGTGTYILALLFPKCTVIGVDVNPKMVKIASDTYKLPNLKFIVDDGEKLEKLEEEKIVGFFNCSSIHHITSFNDYNPHKAFLTIKRQAELLIEGGVLVIRDFVKPESKEVVIRFPQNEQGEADSARLVNFSKTARSLSKESEKGFSLQDLGSNRYRINMVDAIEFVRRKDYVADWDVELQEEYAYYSQQEFEDIYAQMGLRTITSGPIYNPWIIENRYKGKFEITDLFGKQCGFPATNYVIAGEKVKERGTKLMPIRQLPIMNNSFLKLKAYKNTVTGSIYDVVQRPQPVIDILPYFKGVDGNFKIIAKHGYPRPIINQINQIYIVDNKHFSGYLTESITAMKGMLSDKELIKDTLIKRTNINPENIGDSEPSVRFYPSPGGLDEMVDSFHVELFSAGGEDIGPQEISYSGFEDSGKIRIYDALQLLKSIQVGAVPDMRLEINLYDLLHKHDINKGAWLNDRIELISYDKLKTTSFDDFINGNKNTTKKFEDSTEHAGFLRQYRTKFYEYNREDSTAIFESVIPENVSLNTVVLLPVCKYENAVYIGLETRFLPVPQIHEQNSFISTAPAFRLPKEVNKKHLMEKYISNITIGDVEVSGFAKLGEKYLPCTGITPEQVYPYVVYLSCPTDKLTWVAVNELFNERNKIRDGHLLVSLLRLMHALELV